MNMVDADRAREELERAVETGVAETIARTAEFHIWPLYTVHSEKLVEAVVTLPSAVLDRHPLLRILHPMTAVFARTSRPLRNVAHTPDARTMSQEEIDFLLFAQMTVARFRGELTTALTYAGRLEDRLLQTSSAGRDSVDGPLWFFHHQIGTTLLAAGDTGRALLELATSRQFGRFAGQAYAERMAAGRIALAHAVRGSLDEAESVLAEAKRMPEVATIHASASAATEDAAAALIAVDRMSPAIDDLLACSGENDSIEFNWPFLMLARCRAYLARQRPEDALEAAQFAADAHATQRGSFGADATTAMSVEALTAMGDVAHAWRVAKHNPRAGALSRLAIAQLALRDDRLDVAEKELRALAGNQTLGPAKRAATTLYTGWLEVARSGELDPETARQIARIVLNPDRRRLLMMLPKQLIERVRNAIPPEAVGEFDAVTADLVGVDMRSRPVLTTGELRVLHALPAQQSTAAMATAFHVSPNTVKSQLQSLYRKLGCSSRDDAVRIATRLRLLTAAMGE